LRLKWILKRLPRFVWRRVSTVEKSVCEKQMRLLFEQLNVCCRINYYYTLFYTRINSEIWVFNWRKFKILISTPLTHHYLFRFLFPTFWTNRRYASLIGSVQKIQFHIFYYNISSALPWNQFIQWIQLYATCYPLLRRKIIGILNTVTQSYITFLRIFYVFGFETKKKKKLKPMSSLHDYIKLSPRMTMVCYCFRFKRNIVANNVNWTVWNKVTRLIFLIKIHQGFVENEDSHTIWYIWFLLTVFIYTSICLTS
jgi:hypothetical protein